MSKDSIGPYKVLRLIKQGGGGSVYAAFDQRLKRRVALKFIPLSRQKEQRRQFIAEARALAAVSHRLIVQIFDVVELRKHIVLVMEYVPGTDLADLVAVEQLDLSSVLQVGMDLSAALAAVHELGIVHGDVKLENVLLDLSARARLADFGIAANNAENPLINGEPVTGSLASLSPEQLGGAVADSRSDLYALGTLIYSLAARQHPFGDRSDRQAFLARLSEGGPPRLSTLIAGVPARLDSLLAKLMAAEPDKRPVSTIWVRQELAYIRRELPIGRVDSLVQQVVNAVSPEDAAATVNELPSGVSGSARSHLLSDLQWRPWNHSGEQRWRRLAMLALVSLVALAGLSWQREQAPREVVSVALARPELMLVGGAVEKMSADDLTRILRRCVAAHPQLVNQPGPAPDLLTIQVRCNPYTCGMLLRHQARGSNPRVSYSTLLAEAPMEAWEARLAQGLADLFKV